MTSLDSEATLLDDKTEQRSVHCSLLQNIILCRYLPTGRERKSLEIFVARHENSKS